MRCKGKIAGVEFWALCLLWLIGTQANAQYGSGWEGMPLNNDPNDTVSLHAQQAIANETIQYAHNWEQKGDPRRAATEYMTACSALRIYDPAQAQQCAASGAELLLKYIKDIMSLPSPDQQDKDDLAGSGRDLQVPIHYLLKMQPNNSKWLYLAGMSQMTGDPTNGLGPALDYFRKAAMAPEGPQVFKDAAAAWAKNLAGQGVAARPPDTVVQVNPNAQPAAAGFIRDAQAFEQQGDVGDAAIKYQSASELIAADNPAQARAYMEKAVMDLYEQIKQLQNRQFPRQNEVMNLSNELGTMLDQMLKLDPRNAQWIYLKGVALMDGQPPGYTSDICAAYYYFQKAAIAPDGPQNYRDAARATVQNLAVAVADRKAQDAGEALLTSPITIPLNAVALP